MKPQFKLEQIYLDLSKLSEEQQRKVIALLPKPINKDDYTITYMHFYLIYDDEDCMWWVSTKYFLAEKTEINYSQFLNMMGESEEVLQVENNGWIKIESESIIPNGDYWMIENEENEIMAVFDVDEDTNQDSIRKYYSHYQPIIKPEPPKF